jgi:hypothetical protein
MCVDHVRGHFRSVDDCVVYVKVCVYICERVCVFMEFRSRRQQMLLIHVKLLFRVLVVESLSGNRLQHWNQSSGPSFAKWCQLATFFSRVSDVRFQHYVSLNES